MADDSKKPDVEVVPGPVAAQPQVVIMQQPSNVPPPPTEGLLQPKEGEQVFYIVRGQKVDPDGNPVK